MNHTPPLVPTERGDWRPTTDDHYTPAWIFEAMGLEFDVDVAAPPGGVPWIPAKRYHTIHDDGLAHDWHGLVWCNPPFRTVSPWARRFNQHPDGVMLAPTSKAAWLSESFAAADIVLIPRQPIDFLDPDGVNTSVFVMTILFGRGTGTPGVERLAPYGTLVSPRKVA